MGDLTETQQNGLKTVGVGSLHLIADHDFVHHAISKDCSCRPEQIAHNVWKHNASIKYRTYKVSEDGKIDMIIPDQNT